MLHNFPGLYLVILNKYRGRATCRMYDFLSSIHLIELRELIGFLLLLTGECHVVRHVGQCIAGKVDCPLGS